MITPEPQDIDQSPALVTRQLCINHRLLGSFVEDVTLQLHTGEVLALVGESGSGKSLTAMSLMRLLPEGFEISGEIRVGNDDLQAKSERDLNAVRGRDIAMLFQQPQAMLDPTATVAAQVSEPLQLHLGMSRGDARKRVVQLLREVGIPEPEHRAASYSFQLSGGMAQRVMIAMALAGRPKVLIADEPTTALDVTVQVQILNLLQRERRERSLTILLITHDLGVVSAFADRVAVMYAGRIIEQGSIEQIMQQPQHPYTKDLIECSMLREQADGKLRSSPGTAPSALGSAVKGCRYAARCTAARSPDIEALCDQTEPTLEVTADGRGARCWVVNPPVESKS